MMNRWTKLLMLGALMLPGIAMAQSNPCNPCGGKAANPCNPCGGKAANPCAVKSAAMPALNPCHAKLGTVFHVSDPMKRDSLTFTSEAPLEDIVGTTNEIHGYVVFDPSAPEKGAAGKFVVPVASLDTGIPLRDEHLQSPMWLNAEKHPHITFEINGVRNLRLTRESGGVRNYEGTITGDLTLNGVRLNKQVPARVSYMTASGQTASRLPGNLLVGRAQFTVLLKDHRIQGMEEVIGSRVSDSIDVEIRFAASDQKPEAGANPCNPCGGKNPCNPCGGKAANPCNPCGGKAANPCNPCGGKAANPCNPCGGKAR
jgi:polyisoprenoid-binding protein YceI